MLCCLNWTSCPGTATQRQAGALVVASPSAKSDSGAGPPPTTSMTQEGSCSWRSAATTLLPSRLGPALQLRSLSQIRLLPSDAQCPGPRTMPSHPGEEGRVEWGKEEAPPQGAPAPFQASEGARLPDAARLKSAPAWPACPTSLAASRLNGPGRHPPGGGPRAPKPEPGAIATGSLARGPSARLPTLPAASSPNRLWS